MGRRRRESTQRWDRLRGLVISSVLVAGLIWGGYVLWTRGEDIQEEKSARRALVSRLEGTEGEKWDCASPIGRERVELICGERLILLKGRLVHVQPVECGEEGIRIDIKEGVGNGLTIEKSGLMRRKEGGRSVVGQCKRVVPKP